MGGHLVALADPKITTFQAVVLGLLQGVTELFPISSLGHTVLLPHLFGWSNIVAWQSQPESPWLAFVVALHVGSAVGLIAYFWRDWAAIVRAFFATLGKRRADTATERFAWLIIVASIPTGILGLVFEHAARVATSKPEIAAIFLVVNGLVLLGSERLRRRAEVRQLARREGAKLDGGRELDTLAYREAALIGVVQSTALVAGMSRDGVVMSAGLARGLDNSDSARFAFFLAAPIILLAGLYKIPSDLLGSNGNGIRGEAFVAGACAAVAGVVTVHFLSRYFRRGNLIPFGIYCLLFGGAMIAYNA